VDELSRAGRFAISEEYAAWMSRRSLWKDTARLIGGPHWEADRELFRCVTRVAEYVFKVVNHAHNDYLKPAIRNLAAALFSGRRSVAGARRESGPSEVSFGASDGVGMSWSIVAILLHSDFRF
jgi:hypothetical protein